MKFNLIAVIAASSILLAACGGGSDDAVSTEASVRPFANTQSGYNGIISTSGGLAPATIRTRYGFDSIPNTPAGQGAGQLIAVISAYNNPNLAKDLSAFSAKYGLPQCSTVKTVVTLNDITGFTANVSHPVPGAGCTIQVINTANGQAMPMKGSVQSASTTLPSSSGWFMESSADIEWVHAMAPQASILVIQASTPFLTDMAMAATYASKVGANVVSMSWGANEIGQTDSTFQCLRVLDSRGSPTNVQRDPTCSDTALTAKTWKGYTAGAFTGNATYVAASGDTGTVQWPSIVPNVLSVGGTVMGTSVDTAWVGSGGGVSASFAAPAWQSPITNNAMRTVPDVAIDAGVALQVYLTTDPTTGWSDAACVAANGASNCGWYAVGGTSLGAPMWAGLIAVSNATRAANSKPVINVQSAIYNIALVPGQYVTSFGDVVSGSTNYQSAKAGYDLVTGLGTPIADVLLGYLIQ